MNENINLVELLKDCPKGTKFYTPICGEVELVVIDDNLINTTNNIYNCFFTKEGYYSTKGTPECLLFPSKDQRDWNVWKEEQNQDKEINLKIGDYINFENESETYKIVNIIDEEIYYTPLSLVYDISYTFTLNKTPIILKRYPIQKFNPFDRVLVRNSSSMKWTTALFSHYENSTYKFAANGRYYEQCIPYNFETKYLISGWLDCPEFYKNW